MTLLETENLVREFGGLVTADDVNLTVEKGEHVSIIGPNGTGESTLINLIARRLGPTNSGIRFKGESIVGLEPYQVVQRGASKLFQTASIFPDLTIGEDAEIAAPAAEHSASGFEFLRHRSSLTDVHGVARDTLGSIGLLDRAGTITTDLPYGDKRRPEISITLASEPDLLFMDEPTAGMFSGETESTIDPIKQVKRDYGLTFVLVEHGMEIVFSISNRTIAPSRGGIIAEGTPDEVRGDEAAQETCLGDVEL